MPLPNEKPVPSADVPMTPMGPVPARGQWTMKVICPVHHPLHGEHLYPANLSGLGPEGDPDVTKPVQGKLPWSL